MKPRFVLLALWPLTHFGLWGASNSYEPFAHPAQVSKIFQAQTQARRTMVLSSEVGGKMAQIFVDRGDVITRPLAFQVDDTRAKLQLAQLEQQKKEATVQLKRLSLEQQKLESEKAYQTREQQRSEQLQQTGGASAQDLAVFQHRRQQADWQVQEQQQLQEAQKLALANLDLAIQSQVDWLERHKGLAPLHWVVTERYKEQGEIVSIGEPLLKCVDTQSLLLELALDEDEILAIPSAKAQWLKTGKNCPIKLLYCSPEILPSSRKRKVQWLIEPATMAQCGIEVSLQLSWDSPSAGLFIPQAYVEESFSQVWIKNAKGLKIPLKTLQRTAEGWLVPTDSFKAGEFILAPPSPAAQQPNTSANTAPSPAAQ